MSMSRHEVALRAWVTRRMHGSGSSVPKTTGRYAGMARRTWASLGTRTRIMGASLTVAGKVLGHARRTPRAK